MPHQRHQPHWLSLFLLLLLCTILVQFFDASGSTIDDKNQNLDAHLSGTSTPATKGVNGISSPAREGVPLNRRTESGVDLEFNPDHRRSPSNERDPREISRANLFSSIPSSPSTLQRRDDEDGDEDGDDDDDTPDVRPVGYAYHRDVKIKLATKQCDPNSPEVQGPDWSGNFSSNSRDGVYPSTTQSCTWTVNAYNNNTRPSTPYIVSLTFWGPVQLVCGIDYLTLYDGPDIYSPLIARICGNIWVDSLPTYYSSGPVVTAVFSTQEKTPGSFGFVAGWVSVLPCNICVNSGRGTCSNANTCVCNSGYTGSVCQTETTGFKDFTARSQHSMAYDPSKDMVYITGGTSSVTPYMGDILTYTFATNKWNKVNPKSSSKIPDSRYGHCSFVYNEDLYIYGGVVGSRGRVDMWRLNGKQWLPETAANPDQVPKGRVGQTCTLITTNNTTQLAVFGGMNDAGRTMRELNFYNFKTSRWEKAAHQNSIALSGATAVYHKATESIYYFGGMINQTTRNVITYQYVIQQDLWHALAPRIDPLTAVPVTFSGQNPSNSSDGGWDGDGPENDSGGLRERYLPPVMYDSSSVVWSPASLVDDDLVVFYGGMRPFGLGINPYDSSCYAQSVLIYDLSCHNWTKIEFADITGTLKSRVNHTMILRPPRSPGGSATTAWTLYVFGGFDGRESQDMFNITFNIPTSNAAGINACRALRWCNHYDDCQNCNQHYCTYVNGLCLFDTEKASQSSSSGYLVGETSDIPKDGTFQDLIRQRPELRAQVMTEETCPPRTALDTGATHNVMLQPGQEASFKTFIDANDLDIQFQLQTNPSLPLQFRSSNVWEGYMNMYWRATHGLTDNSWDGYAWTSSPIPSDIPDTLPNGEPNTPVNRVVTTSGTLNTTELYSRWMKYAGLDASPSTSALWQSVSTFVDFPAVDPRRFSGYYIYTIKNLNQEPVALTLVVNLLDHTDDDGSKRNGQFDLATLGFAMVGFIVGVLALFLIGHKVRKLLNEREQINREAAMVRLQQEQERAEEVARQEQAANLAMAASAADRQSLKDRKPMYRIVVGVQPDVKEILGIGGFDNTTLRHRHVNRNNGPLVATLTTPGAASALGTGVESKASLGVPGSSRVRSHSESVTQPPPPRMDGTSKTGSPRSDFICDLGSTQTHSTKSRRSTGTTGAGMGVGTVPYIHPRDSLPPPTENARTEPATDQQGDLTLDFGTSFNSCNLADSLGLPYESSGKRAGDKSGNQEGRQEGANDIVTAGETRTRNSLGVGVGHGVQPSTDSAPTVIDFGASHISDTIPAAAVVVARRPRRNPVRVQPISIEPLPFHGALVPRTKRNFRRYQRLVAKRRPQVNRGNSRSRTSLFVRSLSQKSTPKPPAEGKNGALKRAQRAATRLNLKASMDPSTGATTAATAHGSRGEDTNAIEMIRLERGGSRRQPSGTSSQGPVALEKLQQESEKNALGPRSVRTRGPRGYDPGPLVAVNVLIVFPGDAKTRPVMITEPSDEMEAEGGYGTAPFVEGNSNIRYSGMYASSATGSMDPDGQRLPPMAIGTLIAPDPVRWWAYKTRQYLDRQQLEKETKRLYQQQQRQLELQRRRQDQLPGKPAE